MDINEEKAVIEKFTVHIPPARLASACIVFNGGSTCVPQGESIDVDI